MKKHVLLLLLIPQVAALNVSIILDDNVTVQNGTVIHRIHALTDVENVSVVDYYPDRAVPEGIPLQRESFMGNMTNAAKLNVGNLSANQVATVKYRLLAGSGEALLGADIYYIEGERHQLYPKSIKIGVKKNAPASTKRFLIFPFLVILLIMILMYFKQRRGGRVPY